MTKKSIILKRERKRCPVCRSANIVWGQTVDVRAALPTDENVAYWTEDTCLDCNYQGESPKQRNEWKQIT